MALDIYRRQARNLAWYDQDGEVPSHNPFKKFRRTPRRRASIQLEEQGASVSGGQENKKDIGNPEPSGAFPPEPAGSDQNANGPVPLTQSESPVNILRELPFEVDENGRPRNRKERGFLARFKRSSEEQEPDDSKPVEEKPKFTVASQIRATVFNSWINILIVAAPVGIALHVIDANPIAIFVVNFIAIIPLAAMLSYATEEIALRTGETIGGLLNASFGNAVELIVAIIALVKDEVVIVQTSLIGSILSNLLLILGMCFFFGGVNRMEQHFNVVVAQTAASLLSLAVGSLIIPTAFHKWSEGRIENTAPLSRGTSVLLLIVYGCYLFFQLKSHTTMYNQPSPKVEKRRQRVSEGDANRGLAQVGRMSAHTMGGQNAQQVQMQDPDDEPEQPQLTLWVALLTLLLSTTLVAVCAEFMVDSIEGLTEITDVGDVFVGLILLPIVGNAAEHATAVTVACKDKMDLAIGVAVGSSMQIALLVLPLIVVLGWIIGIEDMTLNFDAFQVIVLFVAVLLVNYLIGDGKSHWLEGVLLMMMYLIIAIAAWFF